MEISDRCRRVLDDLVKSGGVTEISYGIFLKQGQDRGHIDLTRDGKLVHRFYEQVDKRYLANLSSQIAKYLGKDRCPIHKV
jgi:hypothetical protein